MDDPIQEIAPIVRSLCQGDPKEQKAALETYFTEDAAFYHPFCRVDSFPGSRNRILAVFRWYRIMSPRIELDIQSIAYDEVKQILYVTIHQVFAIWFLLGLSYAPVTLTTKLQLEEINDKYLIKSQNDLYQVDEFLKFVTFPRGIGSYVWRLWQVIAGINCVILAWMFYPFTVGEQWYSQRGGQLVGQMREKSATELVDDTREALLSLVDTPQHKPAAISTSTASNGDTQQFGKMRVVKPR